MATSRAKPAEAPPVQRRDAPAYTLLEEARLRCERLSAQASTEAERAALRVVHRELGMAGFLASSSIESDVRHTLLAVAYEQATRPVPKATDAERALIAVGRRAERAVERALADRSVAEPMHLAHLHILRAGELLAEHLAANGKQAPAGHAH